MFLVSCVLKERIDNQRNEQNNQCNTRWSKIPIHVHVYNIRNKTQNVYVSMSSSIGSVSHDCLLIMYFQNAILVNYVYHSYTIIISKNIICQTGERRFIHPVLPLSHQWFGFIETSKLVFSLVHRQEHVIILFISYKPNTHWNTVHL